MPGKAPLGSYEVVKAAFERCYDELGVSCQDVGGLIDFRKKQYKNGAQACGGVMPGMLERLFTTRCSARFNLCILGQGVFDCGFVGSLPAQSPTPGSQNSQSQNSQPYQPATPTAGKAQSSSSGGDQSSSSGGVQSSSSSGGGVQSSSSGGVNVALIVGLSSICTLFFVLMAVALSKRKSPRSHKSPPNVMFEMGGENSSVFNPNGGEPAKALDENSIV